MAEKAWIIPSDWDGETWQHVCLAWPASPKWGAILVDLMDSVTRGRNWDRETGTITDAQSIGWEIFRRFLEWQPCGGDDEETIPPDPDVVSYYYAVSGESEDGDMSCNPCIRWNDGILEVFSCGEWVPVPGTPGDAPSLPPEDEIGDPTVPQPGDDPDVEIDVKCRAAWMIANAMWRVHERIVDYVDDIFTIPFIGEKVKADLPEYTLNTFWISSAAVDLVGSAAGLDFDIVFANEGGGYVADLASYLTKIMPTRYTLNIAQWEAVAEFLTLYSFHEGIEINLGQLVEGSYWSAIFRALGHGTVRDLMARSRQLSSEEFDCHERTIPEVQPPLPPTDSGPWFTGLITKQGGEGVIVLTALSPDMRKVSLRWLVESPGYASTDLEFIAAMISPSNLTSLTLRLTGEYPVANWHSLPYSRWDDPHIPSLVDANNIDTTLGEHTSDGSTWVVDFDAGKPAGYKAAFGNTARFLPQSTEPNGGSMAFQIEIIAFTLA